MNTFHTLKMTDMVAQSPGQISTCLDGETILMHVQHGTYFSFNTVGSAVWSGLETPISIEALCDRMAETFDAPAQTIQSDVLDLLTELQAKDLITVAH